MEKEYQYNHSTMCPVCGDTKYPSEKACKSCSTKHRQQRSRHYTGLQEYSNINEALSDFSLAELDPYTGRQRA
jgi:uncharacterized OB-fold protein